MNKGIIGVDDIKELMSDFEDEELLDIVRHATILISDKVRTPVEVRCRTCRHSDFLPHRRTDMDNRVDYIHIMGRDDGHFYYVANE